MRITTLTLLLAASLSALASYAHADLQIPFFGPPSAMRGTPWPKDPKTKLPYQRFDDTTKQRAVITLPGGRIIQTPPGFVTAYQAHDWINYVSLNPGYGAPSLKETVASIDTFITANKLELTPDDQKKWTAFKANPKERFSLELPLCNWVKLSLALQPNGDKASLDLTIDGAAEGVEPKPLPAGAVELPISGNAVAFSPDSKTLTNGFTFIDPATNAVLSKIEYPQDAHPGYSLAFSKNSQLLAFGSADAKAYLVSVPDHKLLATLQLPEPDKNAQAAIVIGFSPDASLLYLLNQRSIRQWSVTDRKELRRFDAPDFDIRAVALSHDGKTLAVTRAMSPIVALFDTATGKISRTLTPKAPAGEIRSFQNGYVLQFTPDDSHLYVSGFMGQLVSIWTLPAGESSSLPLTDSIMGAAFSPDGKYLAAATWNTMFGPNALYLYDAKTANLLAAARPLSNVFSSTTFSPDGQFLIAHSNDGRVLLFKTANLLKAKPGPFPPPASK